MASRTKTTIHAPDRLTVTIGSLPDMVEKLHYNHEILVERLNDRDLSPEKVGFAANDYAIAAWSMGQWWDSETRRAQRRGLISSTDRPGAAFQPAMEAIANTAKHAIYREAPDIERCKLEVWVADHLSEEFIKAIDADLTGLGAICFMKDRSRAECHWRILLEMKDGQQIDFEIAAWLNLRDWEVAAHPIIEALEAEVLQALDK